MASLPEHLMRLPVGREPLPREVRAEHQRERVIAGAIEVFAKRGYPDTTVDHIVATAKIGVGSFYALFSGKEDCFLAAFDQVVTRAGAEIEAAIPPEATPAEQVCFVLAQLLAQIEREPLQARLALVEAQTAGPEALERYQRTLDSLVPPLRRCREATPAAAELPDTFETAIVGGAVWYLQQRIVLGEVGQAQELLPELAEIVLDPYLGRAETERLVAATSAKLAAAS